MPCCTFELLLRQHASKSLPLRLALGQLEIIEPLAKQRAERLHVLEEYLAEQKSWLRNDDARFSVETLAIVDDVNLTLALVLYVIAELWQWSARALSLSPRNQKLNQAYNSKEAVTSWTRARHGYFCRHFQQRVRALLHVAARLRIELPSVVIDAICEHLAVLEARDCAPPTPLDVALPPTNAASEAFREDIAYALINAADVVRYACRLLSASNRVHGGALRLARELRVVGRLPRLADALYARALAHSDGLDFLSFRASVLMNYALLLLLGFDDDERGNETAAAELLGSLIGDAESQLAVAAADDDQEAQLRDLIAAARRTLAEHRLAPPLTVPTSRRIRLHRRALGTPQ